MILDEILARKRDEVAERRRTTPIEMLRARARYHEPRRGFRETLARAAAPAVIAELKRASPSRGVMRADYEPAALAAGYARAGAAALSVLTDGPFFGGSLEHLAEARGATRLPCLRKDFLVDPYQIVEARAWGADAVLLIVAGTPRALGVSLLGTAAEAGLDVLVEVHTEAELAWAADAGATLIGINNRDLATFTTSLEHTERLAPKVPVQALLVAESGLRTREDIQRMAAAGAHAVLIGEALVERPDPGAALAELLACR
jgi:indole-3-glycerol phosphate synthase